MRKILLLLVFAVSCSGKGRVVATIEDGLTTIDLSRVSGNEKIKLSEIVEPLEFIDVGEDFQWKGVAISDNYLFAGTPWQLYHRRSGDKITAFEIDNKQLFYDIKIDESKGCIYLLPWNATKINVYDFNGNPLDNIPLAYKVPKGKIFVNNDEITVATLPIDELNIPALWVQDRLGNVIHSIDNEGHFADIPNNYSNEVKANIEGDQISYSVINAFNLPDTLYNYNPATNSLLPRATIHIKELKPTEDYDQTIWRTIVELPQFYLCNVAGTILKERSFYQGEAGVTFIVRKDDLTGGGVTIVNDYLDGQEVHPSMLINGYFVTYTNNSLTFGTIK